MITGEVTSDREAIIHLRLIGPTGLEAVVRAVIDTGFTEYVSLPPAIVEALSLLFYGYVTMYLAGNVPFDSEEYLATVEWDGETREVTVVKADGDATIGTALLQGYRLTVDTVDGGQVTITPL